MPAIVTAPEIRGGESCAVVTSSGSVIITGPRRPDIAVAIARLSRWGRELARGTSTDSFVTWRAISTICRPCEEPSWRTPLPWAARGTSPTRRRTGTPSHHALPRPVIELSTPGPDVTATTARRPVARAWAAAANIAPASWRVVIERILLSSSASWIGEMAPPGMPNTTSTPASSSMRTTRSAPRTVGVPVASVIGGGMVPTARRAGGDGIGETCRSRSNKATRSSGLGSVHAAPAARALASTSGVSADDVITTWMSRVLSFALIRRHASSPSSPGM